jgi:membrane protease subunit HflK
MAWNEPGGGRNNDPWGNGRGDQGPPDLDEAFRKLQQQLNSIFGGGGGGSGSGFELGARFYGIVAAAVLAAWFLSGLTTIDEQQRGVVFRFGQLRDEVMSPGLQWYPRFVDTVEKVNVSRVESYEHEASMLTRDDNIVKVNMKVQYQRAEPRDFVVNVALPEDSLKQASESALRHVVGSSTMDDVLTIGRAALAAETRERTQSYLDEYGTGIRVVSVIIDETSVPNEVLEAFNDVQRAREDQERSINEANAYAESILPEARGEAQQTVEQANAYRDRVIARAEGEADRFSKLYTEYQRAPDVTRDRLYIETMQQVLGETPKVLIDVEGSGNMMYLPLDRLTRAVEGASARSGGSSAVFTQEQIRQLTDEVVREVSRRNANARRETR